MQANQRKAEINRLPEQIVLSEVRRMVEEMQNLNKQIENTVSLLSLPSAQSLLMVEFILCLISIIYIFKCGEKCLSYCFLTAFGSKAFIEEKTLLVSWRLRYLKA